MSNQDPIDEFEQKQDSAEVKSGGEQGHGETETPDADFYLRTIEDLRRERHEYYDRLLRKQAEFENYRKRINREKEEAKSEIRREIELAEGKTNG